MDDFQRTLPKTHALLAGESRLHFGGQIAVRHGGTRLFAAFGVVDPETAAPMTADHVLCWRSAGKPATAVALYKLHAAGDLSLDDPVARHVPDFGKQAVTLRHLLTHASGVAFPVVGWPNADRGTILERICAAPMKEGAVPGEAAAYDPVAAWYLLGEVVARVTGRPVAGAVKDLALDGLDAFLSADFEEVAGRLAPQFSTERGAVRRLHLHERAAVEHASPGSSCRGTADALAGFYESLLDGGLLPPGEVADVASRHREGLFDETFGHRVDFGLGLIVNSARYGAQTVPYGYGLHAPESAFGHGGAQCAIGFADPENGLVAAWVVNGLPGEPRHNKRNRDVNTAIYEDLGLAP